MMLLGTLASAHALVGHADVAPSCTFDSVSATLPHNGETDVAVDVLPTLFLSDCGAPESSGVARISVGDERVFEERVESTGDGTVSFIEIPFEMDANTAYELWLTPSDGGEEIGLSWETGDRLAELDGGAPEVTVDPEWTWYRDSGVASFFLTFEAEPDPEGVSYVEAIGPDGAIWGTMLMTQEGPHTLSGDVAQSSRPSDVCLTLFHRLSDGSFLEGDTTCDDGRVGCSTGALGAALVPGLFALMLVRRRR